MSLYSFYHEGENNFLKTRLKRQHCPSYGKFFREKPGRAGEGRVAATAAAPTPGRPSPISGGALRLQLRPRSIWCSKRPALQAAARVTSRSRGLWHARARAHTHSNSNISVQQGWGSESPRFVSDFNCHANNRLIFTPDYV